MSIKDGPGEGTWSVFAQKVVEQRDEAREEAANLRKTIEGVSRSLAAVSNGWPYEHEPVLHVSQALKLACDTIDDLRAQVVKLKQERDEIREGAERLRERVEHNLDWFQQRFNRLRQWVKEEVEPLSEDVARRYFAICANGSPSPHESADWRETMHGLSLERDSLRAENDALRAKVRTITEQYKPGWVDGLKAVALNEGFDPDNTRHDGVDPPTFIQDVIETLRRSLRRKQEQNELLRTALEDIRDWAHDEVLHFDDGDISLYDYCARALHRSKP